MPTARGWLILKLVPALVTALLLTDAARGEEAQSLLGWRSSSPAAPSAAAPAKSREKTTAKENSPSQEPQPSGLQVVQATPALEPTPATSNPNASGPVVSDPDTRPRALLIRNPNTAAGESPFALADNRGQVQRLVEPTVGIQLEDYLGQVVRVNHDSGAILLASQLELPVTSGAANRLAFDPAAAPLAVTPAQFNDASDAAEPLPEPIVLEEVTGVPEGPIVGGLQYPSSLQPQEGPVAGPIIGAPGAAPEAACVGCGAIVQGPYGHTACAPNCPLASLHWPAWGWSGPRLGRLDFSVDALWLQTHDSAAGNSGSDYDLATRWELGYRRTWDRRLTLRYFEYDTSLTRGALDIDVLDLESQRWFQLGPAARVGVGGGVRWVDYQEATRAIGSDSLGPLLGLYGRASATPALEGVMHLRQSWQFADSSGATQRSTYGVTEFQLGLEHHRQSRAGDFFVRGLFETQYWNDVGQNGADSSSRGMVGFGVGAGLLR